MNLSLYDSRVATFAGWSSQCEATPEEFARAGWMFKPQSVGGDEVECFSCKAVLGGWEKGDNPLYVECHWSRTRAIGHDVPKCMLRACSAAINART